MVKVWNFISGNSEVFFFSPNLWFHTFCIYHAFLFDCFYCGFLYCSFFQNCCSLFPNQRLPPPTHKNAKHDFHTRTHTLIYSHLLYRYTEGEEGKKISRHRAGVWFRLYNLTKSILVTCTIAWLYLLSIFGCVWWLFQDILKLWSSI